MFVKHILSNLSVYGYSSFYLHLLIVLSLLFGGFVYSYLLLPASKKTSFVARVLVGNIISINIMWVLLLVQKISPPVVGATFLVITLSVIIFRIGTNTFISDLKTYFNTSVFRSLNTLFIWGIFLLVLPRVFNGMLRWDEMSTHLSYPQHWINSGGFQVDYSQRYPVYSFGIHMLYSFLMIFGNDITVKMFNGFFFLFLMIGVRDMTRFFKMPWYLLPLLIAVLFTLDHYNEFTFSAMLEPLTWTYTFYMVLSFIGIADRLTNAIYEKDYSTYFLPLILTATIINFKNLYGVYISIFIMMISVRYILVYRKDIGRLVNWWLYCALVLITPSIINCIVSYYYSGDPFFPIVTMNMLAHFPKMWEQADVDMLVASVHFSYVDTLPEYIKLIEIPMWLTLIVAIIALPVQLIGYKRTKLFDNKILVLIWCMICMVLTHFLFPNPEFIRYAYFLITLLCLAYCMAYPYVKKIGTALLLLLFIAGNIKEVKKSLGYYAIPVRNSGMPDYERITYGEQDLVDVLHYVAKNKSTDTIYMYRLAQFRYLMEKEGKTNIGDDIGKYGYEKLYRIKSMLPRQILTDNKFIDSFENYTPLYQNAGYTVLTKNE